MWPFFFKWLIRDTINLCSSSLYKSIALWHRCSPISSSGYESCSSLFQTRYLSSITKQELAFFHLKRESESHCLTQTPWFHVPMFADTLNVWSTGIQTHGSWDIRWEYMCSLSKNERRKSLWSLSSLGMLLAIAYFPLLCHWWYFKAFKGEEKVGGKLLLDDAS